MKKYLSIAAVLIGLSSCAELTPQQMGAMGDGFSQMSRDLNAQRQQNYQQMQQMQANQTRQCETRPDGFGGWVTQCFP